MCREPVSHHPGLATGLGFGIHELWNQSPSAGGTGRVLTGELLGQEPEGIPDREGKTTFKQACAGKSPMPSPSYIVKRTLAACSGESLQKHTKGKHANCLTLEYRGSRKTSLRDEKTCTEQAASMQIHGRTLSMGTDARDPKKQQESKQTPSR
jgi:hypothetical protein